MTLQTRVARRLAPCCALTTIFGILGAFANADEQEIPATSGIHEHIVVPVPGGFEMKIVDPSFEFNDEQYDLIESLLDIPEGESAKFYQERIENLNAYRSGLSERWYRQRAARLISRVDAALEDANARYNVALAEERRALFARYNTLARQGDPSALLKLIREYDKAPSELKRSSSEEWAPSPRAEWTLAPNSLIAQMYEAYYRLRIQQAALATEDDAVKKVVDEILTSDNRAVVECAWNLVDYVALYDCNQSSRMAQALDAARAQRAWRNGRSYDQNRAANTALIPVDSPAQKAMKKFLDVPDGRDLAFYRQRLQEVEDAPPASLFQAQFAEDFQAKRQQALESILRHIVLLTHDSIEGVNYAELDRYLRLIHENYDYPAALELQNLGLYPSERYVRELQKAREIYFARLIATGEYADSTRRREIIKEFAAAAEKFEIVFQVYENFFGRDVNDRTSEFAKELRTAICESGLSSEFPGPYNRAKRLSESEPLNPATFVGRKVDLRGVDVNQETFDLKSYEGKPIVLVLSSEAKDLLFDFESISTSLIGRQLERGDAALIGYLAKPRVEKTRFNLNRDDRYDLNKNRSDLCAARYPVLVEYYSSDSNVEHGTDFPILGEEFPYKFRLRLLLDADGKVLAAYGPSDGTQFRESLWRITQYIDNLTNSHSKR